MFLGNYSLTSLFIGTLCALASCTEISTTEDRSKKRRPTEDTEEIPTWLSEKSEDVDPKDDVKIVLGTDLKIRIPPATFSVPVKVTLRRTNIPSDSEAVELGSPIGDPVQVEVVDPATGSKVVPQNAMEITQTLDGQDFTDKPRVVLITNNGSSTDTLLVDEDDITVGEKDSLKLALAVMDTLRIVLLPI